MALRPVYQSEDEIPAELRDHYTENDDGQFVLQVDGADGWAVENVAGLKSTLGKLKQRAEKAEKTLRRYGETLGEQADPERLRDALDELERLRASGDDDSSRVKTLKAEIESLRQAAKAEVEKAVQPLKQQLDKRTGQLRSILVEQRLTEAVAKAKGKPYMLVPILKDRVRLEETDEGALNVIVTDKDGAPMVKGADLSPATPDDLVAELKADPAWSGAFDGSGNSGGGTQSNAPGGSGRLTPEQIGKMSMAEYRKARAEGRIT